MRAPASTLPRNAKRVLFLGLGVGAIGTILSLMPFILTLEDNVELRWLFALRGPITAPPEVVVVAIDEQTATDLTLPEKLDEWPRSVHAELVNRLAGAGASVIAFDILFSEARTSEHDRAFASAMERAGNVVLLDYVGPEEPLAGNTVIGARQKREKPVLQLLENQAIAVAPFLLPVRPVRVNQFWCFSPTNDNTPNLPVVALQAYGLPLYAEFLDLLNNVRPGAATPLPKDAAEIIANQSLKKTILDIRRLFESDRTLATEMRKSLFERQSLSDEPRSQSTLLSLIEMYKGVDSPYLNFYGPPRSITTRSFQDVLQVPANDLSALNLKNKVVFIGYSARTLTAQQDSFYTVFSQDSGLNLSGPEIAATAFSNLLTTNSIKPLYRPARLAVIFLWGAILTVALCFLSTRWGIVFAITTSLAYITFAWHEFAFAARWWPLVLPLFAQVPLALFGANVLLLYEERSKSEKLYRSVVARLNPHVVDRLNQNISGLTEHQYVNGICLFTDIKDYTALTELYEKHDRHSEWNELLHEYWVLVVTQIAQRDGFVDAFEGDSCLGIWPNSQHCGTACEGAIGICRELDRFNLSNKHSPLITRLGMHYGKFWIGDPGLAGQGTVRSGGTLNIASRIQNANQLLGTKAIISQEVFRQIGSNFATRPLGAFLLKGNIEPLQLYELLTIDEIDQNLLSNFAEALTAFQSEEWKRASAAFKGIHQKFELDGPTDYYLKISEHYSRNGPDRNWNGSALRLAKESFT